jgi:asparagine synthase (glutamine-hydrolysing)
MCGIAGIVDINHHRIPDLKHRLEVMNTLQIHRGPDGKGSWQHKNEHVGLAHRRLSIIDLTTGDQPMHDNIGNWISYNGEIYNYVELRRELGLDKFVTTSDTEVILHAYQKWGADCVNHFRGMFSFALWDETKQTLFCARDRFGIKPFYYTMRDGVFYCASEIKALLPFLERIETDLNGFKDYVTFQFCLAGKTLFKEVSELLPGHALTIAGGKIDINKYWEVYYQPDFNHTPNYFYEKLRELIEESVKFHLRSDVPIGAYISGGLDSSIIASMASQVYKDGFLGFHGKFSIGKEYDESRYARALAEWRGFELKETDITVQDFIENIRKVIYHLDFPTAGPGSFPQFMVSKLASQHRKVVLGGQGGDEIFGGYARYLIAYFEQCIKAAINGSMHSGNFIVTYESIIPNLVALQNYKQMLQEFWREGLFEEMDKRYFRLINRANLMANEVNWEMLGEYSPFKTFQSIFHGRNVGKESYFDLMTHFDFKTSMPALLHVEDRVGMAHGLESRVPFLDHALIEFVATMPADVKFKDGTMKHALKHTMQDVLPPAIRDRKDKMGFPVPFTDWIKNEAKDFVRDIFSSQKARQRELINNKVVLDGLEREEKYSRKVWGLLCIELWQQEFHDQQNKYQRLLKNKN